MRYIRSNQSGVTLIEVVLAAFLLSVFVAGYFWAFLGSKKVGRVNDIKIQAVSVAGNVLELVKEQMASASYYGDDFNDGVATFQSVDPDDDVAFLSSVDTTVGHGITPISNKYTVTTHSASSGRANADGFKQVTVSLGYTDIAQDIH